MLTVCSRSIPGTGSLVVRLRKALPRLGPQFHGPGAYGDESPAFAVALASGAPTAGQQLDLSTPDPIGITAGIAWPEEPSLLLIGFLSAGCPMVLRNRLRQVRPARFVVVCHGRPGYSAMGAFQSLLWPLGARTHGSRHVGGKSSWRQTPSTQDEPGNLPGGVLVQAGKHVAVSVHRDGDIGVAQALAHHLGRDAGSQRRRRVAVPHIMQPDPRQPSRPNVLPEPV
jgi:hypothetical protein